MHNFQSSPLRITLIGALLSLSWTGLSAEIDDEPANSENEIICFAAQKKWVCAPADEKQKAHDKAMKMVQEKPIENIAPSTSQVEIKQLDMNQNISDQVQEETVETALQEVIKDFVSRDEITDQEKLISKIPTDSAQHEKSEISNELPTQSQVVASEQTPDSMTQQVKPNINDPVTEQKGKNRFSFWQDNHAQSWTFQVIGTSNRHQLDQFIVDQGLSNATYTLAKTQVNGADWWVVLTGIYNSREHALSQRDQLPSQLAANAWVRQISSIVGQDD